MIKTLFTALVIFMFGLSQAYATHNNAGGTWYFEGADKPYPTMKDNSYFLIGNSYPVEASYLLRRNGSITYGKTIRITYTIEVLANAPDFQSTECTGSAVNTGTVGILVRKSTNVSIGRKYERFWSTNRINLEPGTYTLVAPTSDPSQWINVDGKPASGMVSEFKKTLANTRDIGITFGGCGHYGHGVKVKGGNARFTIMSVSIQ